MSKLSPPQLQEKINALTGWNLGESQIEKKYAFKDFRDAISFVIKVGFLAEQLDHHPDIDIRYNKVILKLTTHSAGGLTEKDFQLAQLIDA